MILSINESDKIKKGGICMTDFEAVEKFIEEARIGKATKEEAIYKIKNVYYHSMTYPKSLMEIAVKKVEKL
jgi:hypothetical protein